MQFCPGVIFIIYFFQLAFIQMSVYLGSHYIAVSKKFLHDTQIGPVFQLMAGGGVALVGITLIPLLSGLFG